MDVAAEQLRVAVRELGAITGKVSPFFRGESKDQGSGTIALFFVRGKHISLLRTCRRRWSSHDPCARGALSDSAEQTARPPLYFTGPLRVKRARACRGTRRVRLVRGEGRGVST